MKRQSKDQEKLKKLNKEFARSASRRLAPSSNLGSFRAISSRRTMLLTLCVHMPFLSLAKT